jgi:hypothetical protein
MGGTVTVEGWKLRTIAEFSTHVCRDCVQVASKEYEAKRARDVRRFRWFAYIFGASAAAVGILAALSFVAKPANWQVQPDWQQVQWALVIVAAILCLFALGFHFEARTRQSNRFEANDTACKVHEAVLVAEARVHIPQGVKNIIAFSAPDSRPARSARAGDLLVHRDAIDNLRSYPKGGGWSLIWATWKTDGQSSLEDYSPQLLDSSLQNQGFKGPGEFLNAEVTSP